MSRVLSMALCVFATAPGAPADTASVPAPQKRDPVDAAVNWLLKTMASKDWQATEPGMANDQAKRDVAVLVTAWLLEMNADLAGQDAERLRLRGQADRLSQSPRGTAAFAFPNWLDGFATLYVLERSLREGKPHAALDRIARRFVERQNVEGGWGHGGGTYTKFYPSTLVATTNLALLALAAADRFQTPSSRTADFKEALAEGLTLLTDVQAAHGGLPYGGRPYRKGYEAGRTAGMLLALAALRKTECDLFRRASGYALRNLDEVPYGHASPALHIALGALAFPILSDDAGQRYDRQVLAKVRQAQRPDGSFADVLRTSPDTILDLGHGKYFNEAYVAALYAAALSAHRSEIVRQFRVKAEPLAQTEPRAQREPLAPVEPKSRAPLAPIWTAKLADIVALAADGNLVAALGRGGALTFLDGDSGAVKGSLRVPIRPSQVQVAQVAVRGGEALLMVPPADFQPQPLTSLREMLSRPKPPAGSSRLLCCSPDSDQPLWQADVPGLPRKWLVHEESAIVLTYGGEVLTLSLADGRIRHRFAAGQMLVNGDVLPLPQERYALATEGDLTVRNHLGAPQWSEPTRAGLGLNPAAYGPLAASSAHVFAGRTDGALECRDQKTGQLQWRVNLPTAIYGLHVPASAPERLLAVGWDGRVHGLVDGKEVWRVDIGQGLELNVQKKHHRPLKIQSTQSGLLAATTGQPIMYVDAARGEVRAAAPAAEIWSAAGNRLAVCDNGQVKAYPLK